MELFHRIERIPAEQNPTELYRKNTSYRSVQEQFAKYPRLGQTSQSQNANHAATMSISANHVNVKSEFAPRSTQTGNFQKNSLPPISGVSNAAAAPAILVGNSSAAQNQGVYYSNANANASARVNSNPNTSGAPMLEDVIGNKRKRPSSGSGSSGAIRASFEESNYSANNLESANPSGVDISSILSNLPHAAIRIDLQSPNSFSARPNELNAAYMKLAGANASIASSNLGGVQADQSPFNSLAPDVAARQIATGEIRRDHKVISERALAYQKTQQSQNPASNIPNFTGLNALKLANLVNSELLKKSPGASNQQIPQSGVLSSQSAPYGMVSAPQTPLSQYNAVSPLNDPRTPNRSELSASAPAAGAAQPNAQNPLWKGIRDLLNPNNLFGSDPRNQPL
jgi:hypothetical protein